MTEEDPRKIGLKAGLRQLTTKELERVLAWPEEMVLDTYNYENGKFCPLAVAVGLPETMRDPTHEKVYDELVRLGLKVYNTRGIAGEFYTTERERDLLIAVREVLSERCILGGTQMRGNNEMTFNQATMQAAVQHYLDTKVLNADTKVKVTKVSQCQSGGHAEPPTFRIDFSSDFVEQAK